jgi:hypothetical protein
MLDSGRVYLVRREQVREKVSQTDRQTDRHTDTQTHRQTDREPELENVRVCFLTQKKHVKPERLFLLCAKKTRFFFRSFCLLLLLTRAVTFFFA